MVTDFANWLRRKLKLDKDEVNYRFLKRNARYWIMVLGLLVSAVVGISAFEVLHAPHNHYAKRHYFWFWFRSCSSIGCLSF